MILPSVNEILDIFHNSPRLLYNTNYARYNFPIYPSSLLARGDMFGVSDWPLKIPKFMILLVELDELHGRARQQLTLTYARSASHARK